MGKNPPANAGNPRDRGLIPGLGRFPGVGNGNPLQYSCLCPIGQRSLASYSPWGCKESDTTERLTHTQSQFLGSLVNPRYFLYLQVCACVFRIVSQNKSFMRSEVKLLQPRLRAGFMGTTTPHPAGVQHG